MIILGPKYEKKTFSAKHLLSTQYIYESFSKVAAFSHGEDTLFETHNNQYFISQMANYIVELNISTIYEA